MSRQYSFDNYEEYEDQFDPMTYDRKARRKRKPKVNHTPKKTQHELVEEVAAAEGLEGGFNTTYHPGLFEEGWLLSSLRSFYDQQLITDVLARVKGGKEASVYRCEAHPSTGKTLVAAKVYRPRMFRNLRNDKMYRQGREILKANGKAVKETDHRVMRAVNKKSSFGEQVQHTSWLMYEFTTLRRLYEMGGAVPQPLAAAENCILMDYIGDAHEAAHTLSEIQLETREAESLFRVVMFNIELMLKNNLIHGDLSAYNILYWEGDITLIDFPQVVNSQNNDEAESIFQRDVKRICDYFAEQGVDRDAEVVASKLWQRYMGKKKFEREVDASMMFVEE